MWYDNTMKKYIRRLYMKTDTAPFNPFLHVFVIKTLVIGMLFTFYASNQKIESLTLFQLTNDYLPNQAGNFWGLALILVVIGHVLEMEFRGKGFGRYTAMLGFMLWLYAAVVYLLNGNWFGIIAITATSIFFYAWYYGSSINYQRDLKAGIIPPVS